MIESGQNSIQPSSMTVHEDPCASCGAARVGPFCPSCGQRHPDGRLTLRGLWRELPARIFNLERGLTHTFLELFRRPGGVARDYVAGKRSSYVNPLTYFLVAATVQLLGLTLAEKPLRDHIRQQLARGPDTIERLSKVLGEDAPGQLADLYISLLKQGYTYLFLIFMSIPFALCLRVLLRRQPPGYNLAETLIFSIYTTGHLVLLTGILVPITSHIDMRLHVFAAMAIYFVYTGLAARSFYDGGKRRVILALLALAAAFLTFVFVLTIAFLITLISTGIALKSGG